MGLIPAGTGNLLARNLDLPLDEVAAIEVAFDGHTRAIDLIKIIVDDRPPEHFAVMAGIGVDAMIMDETDDDAEGQDRLRRLLRGRRQGARTPPGPADGTTRRSPSGAAQRHAVCHR